MWGAVSDERKGLSFTIAAGPIMRSHSRFRVLQDPWPYFIVSDLRLSQPGGPGSRIYIRQGTGWNVYTPTTVFPFRRLLRFEVFEPVSIRASSVMATGLGTARAKNTASNSSYIVASHGYRHGPRRGHRFPVTSFSLVTKLMPNIGHVYRAVP
jgi:hypothetical protein